MQFTGQQELGITPCMVYKGSRVGHNTMLDFQRGSENDNF